MAEALIRPQLTQRQQIALGVFKAQLKTTLGANLAAFLLFGSRARREAKRTSDIDLLIVVRSLDRTIRDKVIDIACDILNRYGVHVELLTLSQERYRRLLREQWPFMLNLKKEAIPL